MTSSDKVAHAQFTASIPENYDRYLGPVIFEPYARDLAKRLKGPALGRVLETACGSGIVTRRLLEVLTPDAGLTATDLNPAMLDRARDLRHAINLCDMNAKYADVLPSSAVLAHLKTYPAGQFQLPTGVGMAMG